MYYDIGKHANPNEERNTGILYSRHYFPGEIYASDIIAELKAAKLLVVEGTLYPLLTRLKNNGLLSYNWVESTSEPPRKYYQLTNEGSVLLKQLDATWQELSFAVEVSLTNRNQNL